MSGIVLCGFNKAKLNEKLKKLEELFANKNMPTKQRQHQRQEFQVKYNTFFNGIFESSDKEIHNLIETKLLLILQKAIEFMKPGVEQEIKRRKESLNRGPGVYGSFTTTLPNHIITEF